MGEFIYHAWTLFLMSSKVQVGSQLPSGKCLCSTLAEAIHEERRGDEMILPVICSKNLAAISDALLELSNSDELPCSQRCS